MSENDLSACSSIQTAIDSWLLPCARQYRTDRYIPKPARHKTSRVVIAAIVLCFLAISAQDGLTQERLVPFEQNEMWGYKTSSGEILIQPKFAVAEDFTAEGIAAIADAKGWAYIDRKGNILVRPVNYDNGPDPFEEGLARYVADDGKIGFFNKKGKVVIQPQFGGASYFHDGLAAVCTGCKEERIDDATIVRGGKWGYIDHKGRIVIQPRFDYAFAFEHGRAQVCVGCREEPMGEHSIVTGGQWGYVDRHGKIVTQFHLRLGEGVTNW
jgi:hypothetical protein